MRKQIKKRIAPLLSTTKSVYAAAEYLVRKHQNIGMQKLYSIHFSGILNDPNDDWGIITQYIKAEEYRLRRGTQVVNESRL